MRALQLLIAMNDLPTVTRRVIVPERISLADLHVVIQYTMGWQDYHLYQFSTDQDSTCYTNNSEGIEEYEYYERNPPAVPDQWEQMILAQPQRSAEMVSVRHLFANGKALNYVYDFGDNWELRITLEKVMENYQGPFPYCVAGGEAGPPEDVGGTGGFMDFLEAWHNPAHPEHSEMIIWGSSMGFTGRFEQERINLFLKHKLPLGQENVPHLLYRLNHEFLPFERPIAFNPLLASEKAASTHLLQLFTDFLRILQAEGPVKLTAKGNLPVKLVKRLFYELNYDYAQADWRREDVHREADAWFVATLHDLAKVMRLVKVRKNALSLTKSGELFLCGSSTENYYVLLWNYIVTYNLGYEPDHEPFPQFLYRYVFMLLAEFGRQEREIGFYSNKILDIYPLLLDRDKNEEEERYWFGYTLYSVIMQCLLAEFGLVQTRFERERGVRGKYFVQRTPLFDDVFVRW